MQMGKLPQSRSHPNEDNVSSLVDANPINELYQIDSANGNFYMVLTTEKTGTFVLVRK